MAATLAALAFMLFLMRVLALALFLLFRVAAMAARGVGGALLRHAPFLQRLALGLLLGVMARAVVLVGIARLALGIAGRGADRMEGAAFHEAFERPLLLGIAALHRIGELALLFLGVAPGALRARMLFLALGFLALLGALLLFVFRVLALLLESIQTRMRRVEPRHHGVEFFHHCRRVHTTLGSLAFICHVFHLNGGDAGRWSAFVPDSQLTNRQMIEEAGLALDQERGTVFELEFLAVDVLDDDSGRGGELLARQQIDGGAVVNLGDAPHLVALDVRQQNRADDALREFLAVER